MKKYIYHYIIFIIIISTLISCSDFLDELPDNRTEIDTRDKAIDLMVSAYSEYLPIVISEQMSDNVTDRGIAYDWTNEVCRDSYLFNENYSTTSTDSPYTIWESTYKAIAAANLALESIDELKLEYEEEDLLPIRGEALLCRAYGHFTLCNMFCQAYNPQTSDTDLGIPYIYETEITAINSYERGTVSEVYANIASDIEEGIQLIDDNIYSTPKYHFNRAAAYAFASQFYLYYGNYQRAIECATEAIGSDPTNMLRDYSNWNSLTSSSEYTSDWVNSSQTTNLLIQGCYSLAARMLYSRAALTNDIRSETISSRGPWGDTDFLIFSHYIYYFSSGSQPAYFFPKQGEYFVYTDATAGIGYAHIANVMFSAEKTLLNRAEAYVLIGNYSAAATDLCTFYNGSAYTGNGPVSLDASEIAYFYESDTYGYYRKQINPRFTVETGIQENMIHACLHARRILTIHEGTRLLDIKRYGITYSHVVDDGSNIDIQPYDNKLVLQIPSLVIEAGMEANPR